MAPVRDSENRIFTVPNAFTLLRLLSTPAVVALIGAGRSKWGWAAVVLAILGATDGIDGWTARHFDQVSHLGKALDPTVDRVLLLSAGISIVIWDVAPLWLVGAVLLREILIILGALSLGLRGVPRPPVILIGKAGTFALMTAFPLLLAGGAWTGALGEAAIVCGWALAVIGLVLGWIAAIRYLVVARSLSVSAATSGLYASSEGLSPKDSLPPLAGSAESYVQGGER